MKNIGPFTIWLLLLLSSPSIWGSEWPASLFGYGISADSPNKEIQVAGVFGFITDAFNDGIDQSLGTGLLFDGIVKYRLAQDLKVNLDVALETDVGYSQIIYVDDSAPGQSLILNEASLAWTPNELVKFKVGAINQAELEDPIFLSAIAFPSAEQSLLLSSQSFYLDLTASESIPTSSTQTPVSTQTNGLPTLLLGRLKIGIKNENTLSLSVWGSYFNFENLPSYVAQESRLRGNTVNGVGAQGAQFAYAYVGLESGLSLRYHFNGSSLSSLLGAHWIDNGGAPGNSDQAFLGSAGVEAKLSDNLRLTPKIEYFYLESDASPAYYNVTWFGHNNFQGPGASVFLDFPKQKLCLEARYSSGQVISPNPLQNNFTLFYLAVSKTYDFL